MFGLCPSSTSFQKQSGAAARKIIAPFCLTLPLATLQNRQLSRLCLFQRRNWKMTIFLTSRIDLMEISTLSGPANRDQLVCPIRTRVTSWLLKIVTYPAPFLRPTLSLPNTPSRGHPTEFLLTLSRLLLHLVECLFSRCPSLIPLVPLDLLIAAKPVLRRSWEGITVGPRAPFRAFLFLGKKRRGTVPNNASRLPRCSTDWVCIPVAIVNRCSVRAALPIVFHTCIMSYLIYLLTIIAVVPFGIKTARHLATGRPDGPPKDEPADVAIWLNWRPQKTTNWIAAGALVELTFRLVCLSN